MARILIVEDEEKIARFVTLELEHEGYQVEHAADGRTAVDLALERDYDLILLDVLLPQLNGMEVLRRVRKHKDVPVIMVTARDAVMDKVAGLDAGADDYLTKPFAIEELFARIRVALTTPEAVRAASGVGGAGAGGQGPCGTAVPVAARPPSPAIVLGPDRCHALPRIAHVLTVDTGCARSRPPPRSHRWSFGAPIALTAHQLEFDVPRRPAYGACRHRAHARAHRARGAGLRIRGRHQQRRRAHRAPARQDRSRRRRRPHHSAVRGVGYVCRA